MKTTRREFLTGVSAGLLVPSGCCTGRNMELPRYPGWRKGELDLHFIHTGRGENAFYILPDGTTVVNDTGDYYRPQHLSEIPWTPLGHDELLGGDVVARYIRQLIDVKKLDYALVSHWHSDHTGDPDQRFKMASDGRKVCGLALVGEHFDFGRFYDHQYPNVGQYGGADVAGLRMIRAWVKTKGIPQEPFRPGALDQIRLMHDPKGEYRELFSVRNVCANAVCWTGRGEETVDYGAINTRMTGKESIPNENILSMGFVIRYGKFKFWTGGDVSATLVGTDGRHFNYEAVVGHSVGPVTVCKTNHHAWTDAMTKEFVAEVRARTYVNCVWGVNHIQDCNMRWMGSRELYAGDRTVFATQVPDKARKRWPEAAWWKDIGPAGHVVVKVAPGGESYCVYVLDAADESMRVIFSREQRCSA